ncbi:MULTISPECIES: RNA ligase [unclassified Bradyrhizobium]|uniref:RNA ligase n=1 Tax=Bradyrhizobium TaxID=374 RepID=UPI0028EA9F4D|nr:MULTISPECIES: RNA ligase [unclassified Bradyrhizobium]
MFKTIRHISDVEPAVAGKKEIRFLSQPNGITLGCYLFMDSKTFDSPEALECRGIAFDRSGHIVSRPLHKFFNVGEKEWLAPDRLLSRDDIVAIYDKLDGSMVATAWVEGQLKWRSKKSFNSDVVHLAAGLLDQPEHAHINAFAKEVASAGMTAIFELTHPDARIVVAQEQPELRLLHVRDNVTGQYVMLDSGHAVHDLVAGHGVPLVHRFDGLSLAAAIDSLADMEGREGYVIQFANGDMVKIKCPWYLRIHRSLSFLRERDIAWLALNEELDDVKGHLVEAGVDLAAVNEVEARLKSMLSRFLDEIEAVYQRDRDLDRKSFAIANKDNPLFGLAMQRYLGKEVTLLDWYGRTRLKDDFSLRPLVDETLIDALDG